MSHDQVPTGSTPRRAAPGLCLAITMVLPVPVFAGTFVAVGPQSYQRGTGSPVTVVTPFAVWHD